MLNLAKIDPLKVSSQELFILMNGLKHYMHPIHGAPENVIDFVGTGGDGKNSINFSTLASFIIAASGVPVAKHGSRSVSSKSGSFDVLDALKIPYFDQGEQALAQLEQFSLTFLCAPFFNPIFNEVGQLRKSLALDKKLTVFNLLGPLLNPMQVRRRAIGVYSALLIHPMIETLKRMDVEKALVFYGEGFDEFTITGKTIYALLDKGEIQYGEIDPTYFGLSIQNEEGLMGGDAQFNADCMTKILSGEHQGPMRDMALLNAAAGIFVGKDGIDFKTAFEIATQTLSSGKAYTLLSRIRTGDKILNEIVAHKLEEAKILSDIYGLKSNDKNFLKNFSNDKINIIAEIKPRSPSSGKLEKDSSAETIAKQYEAAGVAAISVLTDEKYFGGNFELLKKIASQTQLPILCKDIIVDNKQVKLARAAGASACLLIMAALTDITLMALKAFIESYNMTAVIEVHSKSELERALKIGATVILINHRNLQNFSINNTLTEELIKLIPKDIMVISASGFHSSESVKKLPKRVNAVLIGTALMKSQNPKKFIEKCL